MSNASIQPFPLIEQAKIRRILVIKWGKLGDLVTATAIFEDIKHAFPNADIDLNTLPPWKILFLDDPRFRHIIAIEVRKKRYSATALFHWIRTMVSNKYDLVIDLQSNRCSRLLLSLMQITGLGIPYRLGNTTRFPYNIWPTSHPGVNKFRRDQATIAAAGIPPLHDQPILYSGNSAQRNFKRIRTEFRLERRDYALFCPGSSATAYIKRWGADRYATLAQMLHESGIAKIVLLGTRDDTEECKQIKDKCGDWLINLCGHTQLLDIIPLADNARYVVANDIGTARLAAACNTPMVMIYGPTNPEFEKPGNKNLESLQASKTELPCVCCLRSRCNNPDYLRCMQLITPEQVFISLQSMSDD